MTEEQQQRGGGKNRRSLKNTLGLNNSKNVRMQQSPQPVSAMEQISSLSYNMLQQKQQQDTSMKKQHYPQKAVEGGQDSKGKAFSGTLLQKDDVDMHVYYNGMKGAYAPLVVTSPKNQGVMGFKNERNTQKMEEGTYQLGTEHKRASNQSANGGEPHFNRKSEKKIIVRMNKSQNRCQSIESQVESKTAKQTDNSPEKGRISQNFNSNNINWLFPHIVKGSIQQEQANQNKEGKLHNFQLRSSSKDKNRASMVGSITQQEALEQNQIMRAQPFKTNIASGFQVYSDTIQEDLSLIDNQNEALAEDLFLLNYDKNQENRQMKKEQNDIFHDEDGDEFYYHYEEEEKISWQEEDQIERDSNQDMEMAMRQEEEQEQESPQPKKQKLFQQLEEEESPSEVKQKKKRERKEYQIQKVVQQMMLRKERKIPGSVFKEHSQEVTLVYSSFLGQIAPFQRVFFSYPRYCLKNNTAESFLALKNPVQEFAARNSKSQPFKNMEIYKVDQVDLERENRDLGFVMSDSTHIYNSVVNTLKTAGLKILSPNSEKWNVMWTGIVKPELLRECNKYQRVNHFPNSFHLGRKDLMWKNIQRMKAKFPQDYDICPETYLLPMDYKRLMYDRDNEGQRALYIIKPNASSCGKGIKVVGPNDVIPKKGGHLISKYMSNPHLIEGLKYDLRIYVLVTSYDPLKVYLFKEGLVRFATEKYSNNIQNLKKRFVHLTNYSVNKKAEGYVKNQDKNMHEEGEAGEGEDSSSKWNLHQLAKHFQKLGIDFRQAKERIKDVIIKTLISVEPHIVTAMSRCSPSASSCFEIYGFDILLDHRLKPWLLEVNISPSLSSSSPLDKKIKTVLICDTLNLVGVQIYDRVREEKLIEEAAKNKLMGLDKGKESSKGQGQQSQGIVNFSQLFRVLTKPEKSANLPISQEDTTLVVDFEEEQHRRGNFDLIFPLANNVNYYQRFFETLRSSNELLWRYVRQVNEIGSKKSLK